MQIPRQTQRTLNVVIALLFVPLLGLQWYRASRTFAWDYSINWTAAYGMRHGSSVYDADTLRHLGENHVSPLMSQLFQSTYTSYTGPPSTALLYLPLTFMSYGISLEVYRITILVIFGLTIAVTVFALQPCDRWRGWMIGGLWLALSQQLTQTMQLGQVDAFVALALSLAIYGVGHDNWRLAGIGIGVATLLKISPGILFVYCLVRHKWSAIRWGGFTSGIILVVAVVLGQPTDLLRFLQDVLPSLAGGSIMVQNQSLPGFASRLVAIQSDILSFETPLGVFRLLAPIVALVGVGLIWQQSMRCLRPNDNFAMSLLILAALLTGPITWDHYMTWSIVVLLQFSDRRLWHGYTSQSAFRLLLLLVLGGVLVNMQTLYPTKEALRDASVLRLLTGQGTLGLLLWFGVGYRLLASCGYDYPINKRQVH